MSAKGSQQHAIDYIEFQATDLQIAKAFYQSAFGWEFNDYGPEYCGIKNVQGEGECGGIALSDAVATGGPLVILYSGDLEKSLSSVIAAGGTISLDTISFPGGRRFQFRDPFGNELGVWSDNDESGNEISGP